MCAIFPIFLIDTQLLDSYHQHLTVDRATRTTRPQDLQRGLQIDHGERSEKSTIDQVSVMPHFATSPAHALRSGSERLFHASGYAAALVLDDRYGVAEDFSAIEPSDTHITRQSG